MKSTAKFGVRQLSLLRRTLSFALAFVLIATALAVVQRSAASAMSSTNAGDGLLFYDASGSAPVTRNYDSRVDSLGSASNTATNYTTGREFVIKTSPYKNEAIAGYMDSSGGNLQIMCYDGTSWTNEWNVQAATNSSRRPYDITYESNSRLTYWGDELVTSDDQRRPDGWA